MKHSIMDGFAILAWQVGILLGGVAAGIGFFAYGWLFDNPRLNRNPR